jgi:hypothetical protein
MVREESGAGVRGDILMENALSYPRERALSRIKFRTKEFNLRQTPRLPPMQPL